MDYLCSTLGVTTKYQKWEKENQLPYYILDRYRIEQVWIDQVRTLFMYPRIDLERIPTIKKHILGIQDIEKLPVVLILDKISRQRRQYLLDARIPFIVTEKQIYLPFLGVALQEKYESDLEHLMPEKLQPSAQLLLLYYIYQNKKKLYTSDMAEKLGVTAMTISRSVKQLERTGLFYTEKDGVKMLLIARKSGGELFEEITPWLINPVRKITYISKEQVGSEMLEAGYTALAHKSMLNPSSVSSYAADSTKVRGIEGTLHLLDSERQVQLQQWKYNPYILAKCGCVDVLSLALSLADDNDERIEEAVEEMLNELWEGFDDNGI